jgi:hypothetical protein
MTELNEKGRQEISRVLLGDIPEVTIKESKGG